MNAGWVVVTPVFAVSILGLEHVGVPVRNLVAVLVLPHEVPPRIVLVPAIPVLKSKFYKFYGVFVMNLRVDLHAIDAMPARWRGNVESSPLDRAKTDASLPRNDLVKNCWVHPTHWLISTQGEALAVRVVAAREHGPPLSI